MGRNVCQALRQSEWFRARQGRGRPESLCYVRAAVTGSPAILRASATVAATALAIGACGGDGGRDGGADDSAKTVAIERVAFPARQRVGQQSSLTMTVRNAGDSPIRNLVVVVRGFSRQTDDTPQRPLWLVDDPPAGSVTALQDTYAAGPLAAGRRRTLRWRVTAVLAGTHDLAYAVAGGARTRLPGGGRPRGRLTVRVDGRPPFARVDPRTGRVIRELSRPNG
ncbi:MAG: hypothetical protein QOE31_2645 [Solirubrobacteraceae bacterium]|nr:hypothetical protein [Solirubrobacteraceae bacterium]